MGTSWVAISIDPALRLSLSGAQDSLCEVEDEGCGEVKAISSPWRSIRIARRWGALTEREYLGALAVCT